MFFKIGKSKNTYVLSTFFQQSAHFSGPPSTFFLGPCQSDGFPTLQKLLSCHNCKLTKGGPPPLSNDRKWVECKFCVFVGPRLYWIIREDT